MLWTQVTIEAVISARYRRVVNPYGILSASAGPQRRPCCDMDFHIFILPMPPSFDFSYTDNNQQSRDIIFGNKPLRSSTQPIPSCSTLLCIQNQIYTTPTRPPDLQHPSVSHSGAISAISSIVAASYAASTHLPPIKASPPPSASFIPLS